MPLRDFMKSLWNWAVLASPVECRVLEVRPEFVSLGAVFLVTGRCLPFCRHLRISSRQMQWKHRRMCSALLQKSQGGASRVGGIQRWAPKDE